jgi:hypothetical protein
LPQAGNLDDATTVTKPQVINRIKQLQAQLALCFGATAVAAALKLRVLRRASVNALNQVRVQTQFVAEQQ